MIIREALGIILDLAQDNVLSLEQCNHDDALLDERERQLKAYEIMEWFHKGLNTSIAKMK